MIIGRVTNGFMEFKFRNCDVDYNVNLWVDRSGYRIVIEGQITKLRWTGYDGAIVSAIVEYELSLRSKQKQ